MVCPNMKYLNSSVTSGCFWTAVLLSVQCPHLRFSLRVHLQNIMSSLSLSLLVLCVCTQQLELLRNSPFSVICSLVGFVGEMPLRVCML